MREAGAAQSPGVGAVVQVGKCRSSASHPLTAESSGYGLGSGLGSPQPIPLRPGASSSQPDPRAWFLRAGVPGSTVRCCLNRARSRAAWPLGRQRGDPGSAVARQVEGSATCLWRQTSCLRARGTTRPGIAKDNPRSQRLAQGQAARQKPACTGPGVATVGSSVHFRAGANSGRPQTRMLPGLRAFCTVPHIPSPLLSFGVKCEVQGTTKPVCAQFISTNAHFSPSLP